MAEARGGAIDPALFRRLLTATSKPQTWFDGETAHEGVIAPVPQQGAGIVQAYDAAYATAVLSIDGVHDDDGAATISFNDSDHFVGEHTLNVQNTGAADLSFALGHVKAATMYTFIAGTDVLRASSFPNPIVEGAAAEIIFSSECVPIISYRFPFGTSSPFFLLLLWYIVRRQSSPTNPAMYNNTGPSPSRPAVPPT